MIAAFIQVPEENLKYFKEQTGEDIVIINSPEEAKKILPQAEIITGYSLTPAEYYDMAPNLKWVFIMAAGVDGVPFDKLSDRGIPVSNAGGIHISFMSEHAIGVMIMFSRGLYKNMRNQLAKKWDRIGDADELTDKTLTIIGAGKIGAAIARKAKALDMKVVGLDKFPRPNEHFDTVRPLEDLIPALSESDYVILTTPLTPETYHFMSTSQFSAMKQNAVFINMSRGHTVDEPALIEALEKGVIRGAALDVFQQEPLSPDSKLWDLENVIITPHNCGASIQYFPRAIKVFVEAYKAFKNGQPIPNTIDPKRGF